MNKQIKHTILRTVIPFLYLCLALGLGYYCMYKYGEYVPISDTKCMIYLLITVALTALLAFLPYTVPTVTIAIIATVVCFIFNPEYTCVLTPWLLLLSAQKATVKKGIAAIIGMLLSYAFLFLPMLKCFRQIFTNNIADKHYYGNYVGLYWIYRIGIIIFPVFYAVCFSKSFSFTKRKTQIHKKNKTAFSSDNPGEKYNTFYLICTFIAVICAVCSFPVVRETYPPALITEQLVFILCLYYNRDPVLNSFHWF